VENMAGYVCLGCGTIGTLFQGPGGERLAREFSIPFLGAVPFDPRMAVASDRGLPFVAEHPSMPAALALRHVAQKISASLSE
jgi:hypothetical protein